MIEHILLTPPTGRTATRYLHLKLRAPETERAERPASNVGFALDRSGSMNGVPISLAREAVRTCFEAASPADRVGLVAFGSHARELVPVAAMTSAHVRELGRAIAHLTASGSTDLSGGWLTACQAVADARGSKEEPTRVIVLTDGQANRGITDVAELVEHAKALAKRNVKTTTIGLGPHFDEYLLTEMARAGEGNVRFVERPEGLWEAITDEFGEALDVVARDGRISVAVADGVRATVLGDIPTFRDTSGLTVGLPDLCSRQVFDLLLRLDGVPAEGPEPAGVRVGVEWKGEPDGAQERGLRWSATCTDDERESILRLVAELEMARARIDALNAHARRDLDGASDRLKDVESLLQNLELSPRIQAMFDADLKRDKEELGRERIDAMNRKRMYTASSSVSRGRSVSGKAKR